MIALVMSLWKVAGVFAGGIVVGVAICALLMALVWKAGE